MSVKYSIGNNSPTDIAQRSLGLDLIQTCFLEEMFCQISPLYLVCNAYLNCPIPTFRGPFFYDITFFFILFSVFWLNNLRLFWMIYSAFYIFYSKSTCFSSKPCNSYAPVSNRCSRRTKNRYLGSCDFHECKHRQRYDCYVAERGRVEKHHRAAGHPFMTIQNIQDRTL